MPAEGQPRGDYPFCGERCKLIDLGRWLGGKYQIPVEISPDENTESDYNPRPENKD
jgi:endogenous inhibitor of DNA gyrase (YacG/DUF329 family)